MADALRLAIVGVGWAGTRQVQAIRELGAVSRIEVECLVDSDADHLAAKSAELEVPKTYGVLEQALADPRVDAVSICLPHSLHCSAAVAVARAGKHVLVEKPIAVTVAEATMMLEAAEAGKVKLFVAENLPYQAMARFLREIVRTGEHLGEIVSASVVSGFHAPSFSYPGRRSWLTRPELGGTGTWMLHGIHTMAQLRSILGEVETVYLREHHTRSFEPRDIEGTMSGLLSMASGISVTVLQTSEVRLSHDLSGYVLHGDSGSLRGSTAGCEIFPAAGEPFFVSYPADPLSEYARELEAFADFVLQDRPGLTDGRSERRTLAVVQAGYESAASGQPVNLRDRFGEL